MDITSKVLLSNGVEMPLIGLGVYKVDGGGEVYETVKTALAAGYRHIDTASFYDNETGVGKAIQDSGIPREDIFLTTKVWNDEQGYEETLQAFERSLERLGVDYVDLYLIHWPVPNLFKETWKAFEKLYQEGKVKAIGVSNFTISHLSELLLNAKTVPMVNQVEFHPKLFQKELMEYCNENNIQLEAWSPLARGSYLKDPELEEIAGKYGKSTAQIILRWDVQHGIVTIPKSTKKERQIENADIFDFELTEKDMEQINELHANERVGSHPDHFNY
ncbi:aldo/keto reductase [Halobacillus campisalis]|uniref:Aldo/keto reductase n=1 Tax=Halobacillus campisalis TaxID=435909 RepID=A0ABW2K1V1_9BACI|nr:aldo/keto reductase [Halobacillus campisalis]